MTISLISAVQRKAGVQTRTLPSIGEVDGFVERASPLLAVASLLLFIVWAWYSSRAQLFQFDELLEIAAATAPTSRQVLSFLASGVDFNPPFSHYLVRLSMSLFGPTEWTARLPALLGFVVLLSCLYAFVSRQLGGKYGLLAMLTIMCLPVRNYAVQARPYGLVLGLSACCLLFYRKAANQRTHRLLTLICLCCCTGLLLASHYYTILIIGVLVVVELVRAGNLRTVDGPLLFCCVGPPALVLAFLRDSVLHQRQQLAHYFAKGNLFSFVHGFDEFNLDPLIYCLAILLIAVSLLPQWRRPAAKPASDSTPRLGQLELALGIGFLFIPIVGAVLTQFVTHAYVPRYFLPAALGFVICACYAVSIVSEVMPQLPLIVVLSLAAGFGKAVIQEMGHPRANMPPSASLFAEDTPLLFDTPANYMQVYHYYPSLRKNLWVIADPAASLRYRQYDTDDKIMLALAEHDAVQTISLSAAVRRWSTFRLIPRSADYVWVLQCAMESNAQIGVKQAFGPSNFVFNVTVPAESVARLDNCAAPRS